MLDKSVAVRPPLKSHIGDEGGRTPVCVLRVPHQAARGGDTHGCGPHVCALGRGHSQARGVWSRISPQPPGRNCMSGAQVVSVVLRVTPELRGVCVYVCSCVCVRVK